MDIGKSQVQCFHYYKARLTEQTLLIGWFDNQQTTETFGRQEGWDIGSGNGRYCQILNGGSVFETDDDDIEDLNGLLVEMEFRQPFPPPNNPALPNGLPTVRGTLTATGGGLGINYSGTISSPKFAYSGPTVNSGGGSVLVREVINTNYMVGGYFLFDDIETTKHLAGNLDIEHRARLVGGTLPVGATGMVAGTLSYADSLFNIGGKLYFGVRIGSAADMRAGFGTGNQIKGSGGNWLFEIAPFTTPTYTSPMSLTAGNSIGTTVAFNDSGFLRTQSNALSSQILTAFPLGTEVRIRRDVAGSAFATGRLTRSTNRVFTGGDFWVLPSYGAGASRQMSAAFGFLNNITSGPDWIIEREV